MEVWDQLHALEALEVKTDQYSPLLYPLIESVQPYDVLKAWDQRRDSQKEDHRVIRDEVMNFMKVEVNSEKRISRSRQSFAAENKKDDIPTATTLVSGTSSKRPPEQEYFKQSSGASVPPEFGLESQCTEMYCVPTANRTEFL
ncbi:hypothetical protein GE061_010228 [Apolygus lucorum]|uniref:Uncharacterized protein n=1 Tax=Apolygus lucorum TaxID=248454 RepID=A0A8S9Y3R2_APOLU|nr:hypothetical protein GE061_010228 [Apolygus lucorum]